MPPPAAIYSAASSAAVEPAPPSYPVPSASPRRCEPGTPIHVAGAFPELVADNSRIAPPLLRRFRPPSSISRDKKGTVRFAIASSSQPYHPLPVNRRRSPLSAGPERRRRLAPTWHSHVAATQCHLGATSSLLSMWRPVRAYVAATCTHACHTAPAPSAQTPVDLVHVHRASAKWVPLVSSDLF